MDHSPQEQEAICRQFADIVGVSSSDARRYLEANSWNLDGAVAEYYTSQEEEAADGDYAASDDDQEGASANPQPIPTAGSSSSQPISKPKTQKKFATLDDFNSGNGGGEDDSDDENDKKRNLFAGGEKSGLAVQDPSVQNTEDYKRKIIQKATKKPPPEKEEKPKKSNFLGAAQTLGGDDAPSRVVNALQQPGSHQAERVNRTLHFWEDGFSVDDGDLFRTDDPGNASILNGITQGRAPLSIMNVRPGQEVDVEIQQHTEKYVKPKKMFKPFEGQGNRLGSPTPGDAIMPGSFMAEQPTAKPAATAAPSTSNPDVNEGEPIVTLRVSLGNGTRMTARFNTSHTMGDVYDFVRRSESSQRPFVLQTTFPTKEFTDETEVLGEIPEFKRGGAVVQKYIG